MGIDFTQKNLSICEKSDGISNQKCSHFGASFQSRDGSELKPQMPACSLCSGPLRDHNGRRCTFSETSYAGRQTPARKCKNCREKMVRMCACVRARARVRVFRCPQRTFASNLSGSTGAKSRGIMAAMPMRHDTTQSPLATTLILSATPNLKCTFSAKSCTMGPHPECYSKPLGPKVWPTG